MADLGKYYVQIIPSADGISGGIEKALGGASMGQSVGTSIMGGLKTAIVGAGIGTVIKKSLDAGGALQQSFGGLDTIYEDASEAAQKYAYEAQKAGISANDYAEQAVSFGASLKQAYGGDTVAAVEAANVAILDMADNSAKMGTDITSIQNAYQGFAKQNYTMLDNLKLGYGGTKKEMERLLEDAEKLSGVHYDMSNLGDVYQAIHVIQEDLHLTGVAAAEAEGTFTGSMASMKAAGQNLLANLSLGKPIQNELNILVTSFSTFVTQNLLPMILNIVQALPGAIMTLVTTAIPQIVQTGMQLIQTLSQTFAQNIPQILAQALPMLLQFSEELRANAGLLIDAAIDLILQIAHGLMEGLPQLITYVPQIITNIAGIINDNFPKIIAMGIQLVIELGKGIINAIPSIISNMGNIVQAIISVITAINWLNVGMSILKGIVSGIKSLATTPVQIIKNIISAIKNAFTSGNWSGIGSAILNGIKNGLLSGVNAVVNVAKSIAGKILGAAKSFLGIASPSRVFRDEVGKMVDLGLAEGIEGNMKPVSNAMDALVETTNVPFNNDFILRANTAAIKATPETFTTTAQKQSDSDKYGDIIIPVSIGGRQIDRIVVDAQRLRDFRTGGR